MKANSRRTSRLLPSRATLGPLLVAAMLLAPDAHAIVGGTSDASGKYASVLQLRTDDGSGSNRLCSAVLVAPNLVVTARHCLTSSVIVATCNSTVQFPPLFDPSAITLAIGTQAIAAGVPGPLAAKKLFAESSTDLCSSDIGFVLLAEPITTVAPAPMSFSAAPTVGEAVTAVGFGVDNADDGLASSRQVSAPLTINQYNPTNQPEGPNGVGTCETGPSICQGDSGGGLFATQTGALVGVIQDAWTNNSNPGAFDPKGQTAYCDPASGEGGGSNYASLSDHEALIDTAFTAAGYAPLRVGEPAPAAFGATCTTKYDCNSLICATVSGASKCAETCPATGACPSGGSCHTVGGQSLCLEEASNGASGGCAVSSERSASPWPFVLVPFALVAAGRLRKRRS